MFEFNKRHFGHFFYFEIYFVDIDECATNDFTCDPNAHCVNTVGSHGCQCNEGYTGDGKTCTGRVHNSSTKAQNSLPCLVQLESMLSVSYSACFSLLEKTDNSAPSDMEKFSFNTCWIF